MVTDAPMIIYSKGLIIMNTRKIAMIGDTDKITSKAYGLIRKYIELNSEFMIGDNKGFDYNMQKYLCDHEHKQVTVYYNITGEDNNNLEGHAMTRNIHPKYFVKTGVTVHGWKVQPVLSEHSAKSQKFRSAKYEKMIDDCDILFLLTDGDKYKDLIERAKLNGKNIIMQAPDHSGDIWISDASKRAQL